MDKLRASYHLFKLGWTLSGTKTSNGPLLLKNRMITVEGIWVNCLHYNLSSFKGDNTLEKLLRDLQAKKDYEDKGRKIIWKLDMESATSCRRSSVRHISRFVFIKYPAPTYLNLEHANLFN